MQVKFIATYTCNAISYSTSFPLVLRCDLSETVGLRVKSFTSLEILMDSPLYSFKPIAAVPSYLMNGKKNTAHSSSLLRPSARTSVNIEEREKLTASIISSNARRQPIELDSLDSPNTNGHGTYPPEVPAKDLAPPSDIDVSARDSRDKALSQTTPIMSRPASLYTLNPPIDFDGLSWPSES